MSLRPFVPLALVAVVGVGCSPQLSFDRLPPDAQLLFFAAALSPDIDSRTAPDDNCESLFCYGASARIITADCLGFSEDVRVTVDGESFSTTTRDLDTGVVEPNQDTNGFIETGGWQSDGLGWRCVYPGAEMFVSPEAASSDEHEVRFESDGSSRSMTFTDDGKPLDCGFPRCTITGDYSAFSDLWF